MRVMVRRSVRLPVQALVASASLLMAFGAQAESATPKTASTPPKVTVGASAAGTADGAETKGDTSSLPKFEPGVEFEPKNPNYKVAFSLEDADLAELVRVIGQLTGKRFIFGGKVRNIKATVYSPQKVTVAEAYQAFLSILETNGLTVLPHGRFLKIVESGNVANQGGTPMFGAAEGVPPEDRYVTRIHRLSHVSAEEVATVLGKFKTKEGDLTVHAPGNLLIITDTGTNIRRMMTLVEEIDVGGAGDQVWIEPVHYGSATDLATRINEIFDLKGGGTGGGKASAPGAVAAATSGTAAGGDLHVAKVVADDRTSSLIVVATERAYLRILEFLKRIDVPPTGEGDVHVLPLQHADAAEITKTIQELLAGASAAPGGAKAGGGAAPPLTIFEGAIKVSADKATNSLLVTASSRDHASLRTVIDRLDQPRRQVFIEAVIMDLSVNRQTELGINFHGGLPVGDNLIMGGLNAGKTALPSGDLLENAALGIRGENLPNSAQLTGTGLSIPAFGVVLKALATDGDSDILATPHVLATDNVAAEISVGQNVALQQNIGGSPLAGVPGAAGIPGLAGLGGLGGVGFSGAAQRQDVGTKIKLTPHLNESNEVRLELQEEISEALGAQGQLGVVPIAKSAVSTQLIIKDQQTVVIGGLMRNRVSNESKKIPILGDIPILGALFRSSAKKMDKRNLVLVLTPYIIRQQSDLRAIFERKMQERQEFLDRYFIFNDENDYQAPKDYSRTNGLLEDIRQSHASVEESKRLEVLTQPKELKAHAPGVPLQMPTPPKSGAAAPAARTPALPSVNTPPAPVPNLNVAPPVRTIERVER